MYVLLINLPWISRLLLSAFSLSLFSIILPGLRVFKYVARTFCAMNSFSACSRYFNPSFIPASFFPPLLCPWSVWNVYRSVFVGTSPSSSSRSILRSLVHFVYTVLPVRPSYFSSRIHSLLFCVPFLSALFKSCPSFFKAPLCVAARQVSYQLSLHDSRFKSAWVRRLSLRLNVHISYNILTMFWTSCFFSLTYFFFRKRKAKDVNANHR